MLYSSVKYSFEYITAGQWFSPGTPVSSINKTDCYAIAEMLLKVALNTLTHINKYQ
jgi:hypothetical protein